MKIMVLTHGEVLDEARILSGNTVRAFYLERALTEAGFEVVHCYPRGLGAPPEASLLERLRILAYADRDELAQTIREESPDTLFVGYWELLEDVPDLGDVPIVLDVVAPRILEAMYQGHLDLSDEVRRTLACYRRADRFLVGNKRQSSFLLGWLVLAGVDCRSGAPVDILPISTDARDRNIASNGREKVRFVSGGVSWPWRRTEAWFDRLVRLLTRHGGDRAELTLFSGQYIYAAAQSELPLGTMEASWPEWLVRRRGLLPYGQMQDYLHAHCHVGVELADENLERQYSQSFRAIECLRNGLPLICNGYTELASSIREFDAGWVVDSEEDLDSAVREIFDHPRSLVAKSENASRLVRERFLYSRTIEPLIHFLRNPTKPDRYAPLVSLNAPQSFGDAAATSEVERGAADVAAVDAVEAALPVSGYDDVSHRAVRSSLLPFLLKRIVAHSLRAIGRLNANDSVIIVSRGDIRPANHGAAVKIERTAWGLSHFVGAVYLLSDDRRSYQEVRAGVFRERCFPWFLRVLGPSRTEVEQRIVGSGVPTSDAFLYRGVFDWNFILRTLYLGIAKGSRIFQAEFPGYARATVWARDLLGGKALLVEHNVEYRRLAEQIPDLEQRALDFLKDVEIALCRRSDLVVTVSEADRNRLIEDGVEESRLHVVPHGVDLQSFDQANPIDLRREFDIPDGCLVLVYHGIYLYPPNLEAMEIMATEILPRLGRLGIRAKVLAIGPYPPDRVLHPDILFVGAVDTVAPYLKGADMAVVPLERGGGTRMKILDYFAAGLPVVSTSKGAEGIPVTDGTAILIAEGYDAFAETIARLAADPAAGTSLASAARRFVDPLDWRTIASRYLDLLR